VSGCDRAERAVSIGDLAAALETAAKAYHEAQSLADAASREAGRALNALNSAQKAFDEGVSRLRRVAPTRSGWASAANRRDVA